jgi:hypothetical protein
MNLAINIDDYNENCIFFHEPIKNTVIDNSNFIRCIYSNALFTLNGIYIKFNLHISHIDKYFNKYKCNFEREPNQHVAALLENIETSILQRKNIQNKRVIYKIREQINSNNIKLFTENVDNIMNGHFILKISGIWENETEYGITFKFMDIPI